MPIVGHSTITKYLSATIARDNPSHAYLFYGPEHVGKETTALWFAQGLFCIDAMKKPCERCGVCISVQKGIHGDIVVIKPNEKDEKLISIDQVRRAQNFINKTALHNSYKIVIIKPAELLSLEAANALLKTLEEPAGKSILILIAQNHQDVTSTVRSRLEHVKFSYLSPSLIRETLTGDYTDEQKDFIARFVQGKIGYALALN